MSVAVGVAVHKIEQLFEAVIAHAAHPAPESVGTMAVKGEDVNITAAEVIEVTALDEGCAVVLNFAKWKGIGGVVLGADKLQMLGQPFFAMLDKTLIIRTRHRAIQVIVPGDEASVADGAQQGATADAIAQAVLTAHLVELEENIQESMLKVLYVILRHIL